MLAAAGILGIFTGWFLIPFIRAASRVGWFSAPLEMGGLDTFGLVAIGFGIAAIPAGVSLAGMCITHAPGRVGIRVFALCFAISWIAFFVAKSIPATKVLVLFSFMSFVGCVLYELVTRTTGWGIRCLLVTLLWVSFWFITSGMILTL